MYSLVSLGINIVTYYAPTLFQESLNFSASMALLMGCFLQLWYIFASFVTWYTIDRVGRRPLLISMAIGMCVVLVLEAIMVAIGGSGPAVAAVVFVFLFEACFTWGWMGCVWVVSVPTDSSITVSLLIAILSIHLRSCLSRSEPKVQRLQPQQISSVTSWS